MENIAELKPNCPVEWHLDSPPPGKGKLIWDGKQIVGLGYDNDSHGVVQMNNRFVYIVLVNALIIFAIILVQFLRAWNRQRNNKT
ncbi:MAG: hypothetical protein LBU65_12695 [Planctomycetaceae bacterium]|nr:hypothetical protein [Planctomycetaceae bacterium]